MKSIRPMNPKDLVKVSSLYKDANKFASKNNIRKWTKDNLEKFPDYHLVYEKNGKIIGAISGTLHKKNLGTIEDIAVDRKYRNRLIGDKLIKNLMVKFRKDKISKIQLWIHWTNARAIPFYYWHGFRLKMLRRTHRMKYVPENEDILILEKKL